MSENGGAMVAKNVVQVEIFGHSYTIRGEANQEYIMEVAAYVDRKMREITEKLPVASLSKVAILASLNIADELFKERARRTEQQEELGQRAARLNAVLDELLQDSDLVGVFGQVFVRFSHFSIHPGARTS